MSQARRIGRRRFSVEAALAVLGGASITISGCGGGGGGSSPTAPTAQPGDKVGSVSENHGHVAIVTAAQLASAGAISLQIRGTSDHPHTVQLSAAEITQIAGNGRVSKTSSSDDGHTHTVTFN